MSSHVLNIFNDGLYNLSGQGSSVYNNCLLWFPVLAFQHVSGWLNPSWEPGSANMKLFPFVWIRPLRPLPESGGQWQTQTTAHAILFSPLIFTYNLWTGSSCIPRQSPMYSYCYLYYYHWYRNGQFSFLAFPACSFLFICCNTPVVRASPPYLCNPNEDAVLQLHKYF